MTTFLTSAKLSLLLGTGTTVDVQTMSNFLCLWRPLFLFQCDVFVKEKKNLNSRCLINKHHIELLHGYFTNSNNAFIIHFFITSSKH